jgi:hypothetical protein
MYVTGYLLSSVAYVTDYNNMTVVLFSDENSGNYTSYARGQGGFDNFAPDVGDIADCYINSVLSQCEVTIRWFPLLVTAIAITIKSLIAVIAVHRHAHFRKRLFNSLGDMIVIGTRRPQLQINSNGKYPFVNKKKGPGMFGWSCRQKRIPWVKSLGKSDLGVALFWWSSVIGVTVGGALAWNNVGSGLSISDRLRRFGVGTIDPSTSFIPGDQGGKGSPEILLILILVANSPQLRLSFGYLLRNNQITRISMIQEWRNYYCRRQNPRVSYTTHDRGLRATRWLQLPYWATAILMIINTTLHWLVSQTMFVVEIFGNNTFDATFYINYSPPAIIAIGLASSILVLGITIYYFIPRKTWMPLMGSSAKLVFESCKGLSWPLPRHGIAWGDISTLTEYRTGFSENVLPLTVGIIYPSTIPPNGGERWDAGSEGMYIQDYSDTTYFLRSK